MALTDAQAKIIAANKKKKEEEEAAARKLAADMLANQAKKQSSFPTVTPSRVVTNQVTTPLKEGKPATQRNTTRKTSSILDDIGSRGSALDRMRSDSGRLYSPLDVIRARYSIGDTAQTLANRARGYDNGSWQDNLKKAAEARVARKEKLDSYTRSDQDLTLRPTYQQMIREAKDAWATAKAAGDTEGMRRAHEKAENVRSLAGYSGGIAGDEYLAAQLTRDDQYHLNQVGQNKLKKAMVDRQKAIDAGDIQGQMDASRRIQEIRNGAAYHNKVDDVDAHGRAIPRESMTAEERKDAEYRFQEGLYSVMAGAGGSVRSFFETANQAIDNDMVEKNREYLQDKANRLYEYQTKLEMVRNGEGIPEWGSESWLEQQVRIAENAQRLLTQGTNVDPTLRGQTLMRESRESAAEALDGVEGWKRDLAQAAMAVGQNLPGVALSLIPGVGPALGAGLMGVQAAGSRSWELNEQNADAYYASLILGGDPEDYGAVDPAESSFRGVLSGLVEAGTERIGLGRLADIIMGRSGKSVVANILSQMGVEGTEEGASYIANFLLDKAAKDPNAEWSVEELWQNVKLGAIAGGMMAGGGSVVAGMANRSPVEQPEQPAARAVETAKQNLEAQPSEEQQVRDQAVAMLTGEEYTPPAQKAAEAPESAPTAKAATVTTVEPVVAAAKPSEATRAQDAKKTKQVKLRRIEDIPVEVETVKSKVVATPVVGRNVIAEMAPTLGESGAKAMAVAWDGKGNQAQYAADFVRVYNQALSGMKDGRIQAPDSLTDAQVVAAFESAKNDRQASLATAKESAQYASVAGKESGLVYDDYVKTSMDKKVSSEINTLAKQLGLKVQMVDSVKGGDANADIQGSVVRIEKGNPNPVQFLFGHEMTHRVQELAPQAYREFRDYVMQSEKAQADVRATLSRYAANGVNLTTEEAIDEVTADIAGQMVSNKQLMSRFIEQNKKNQSMLSRFLAALKDLASKLTGRYKAQVNDSISLLEKAVGEAAKQAKVLEKNKNTAQADGAETRFSIKYVNGKQVVWIENSGLTAKQLANHMAVADYIAEHIGDVYTIIESGQKVYIGEDLPSEYTHSKYTDSIRARKPQLLKAKNKASGDLGLLIETATNRRWEKTKHPHSKDAKYGMYRYDCSFAFPVNNETRVRAYDAELLIRNASDGKKYLYDIVGIKENTTDAIDLQQRETRLAAYRAASHGSASGDTVTQKDGKVKFSLKSSVEQTKDLVALHNLSEDKLMKSLELGGFPMPSIAVTKTDIPHTNFGDITLVMNKSTVDPKASKKNVVYSADAWTPTFPRVEYDVNRDTEFSLRDKIKRAGDKLPDMYANRVHVMASSIEDYLGYEGSEAGVIDRFRNEYAIKALYLADKGEVVETKTQEVHREKQTSDMLDAMIRLFDEDINVLAKMPLTEVYAKYAEDMKRVMVDHGRTEEQAESMLSKKGGVIGGFDKYISRIIRYAKEPAYRTETVTDTEAMERDIDSRIDQNGFDNWLSDLFHGLIKDTGIRNEKEIFTPSGKRRTFQQTHYPVTLDNIAKAMSKQNGGNTVNAVGGFYGVKTLRAGTAKRFKSIADMHKAKGRLKNLTNDEAQAAIEALDQRLTDIIHRLYEKAPHKGGNQLLAYDSIGEILMEAAESKEHTVDSIHKTFAQYGYKFGNQLAIDIRDLMFDVSEMPVNIFEAKPERAVRFDEVLAAVIPSDSSEALRAGLRDAGVNVLEYEAENDVDRLNKVNSVENATFSLKGGDDYQTLVEKYGAIDETPPAKRKKTHKAATAEEQALVDDMYYGRKTEGLKNKHQRTVETIMRDNKEAVAEARELARVAVKEARAEGRENVKAARAEEREAKREAVQKAKQTQKEHDWEINRKLREQKNAKIAELKEAHRERIKELKAEGKAEKAEAVRKAKDHYKDKEARERESRKARELRTKIVRHVNDLRKKLISPTDTQHIPKNLSTSVAAVLNAINLESSFDYGVDGRVARGEGTPTKRTQAFQQLRLAYENVLKEADQQLVIDPDLISNIQELEALKDTPVASMSVSQLTTMWNTVRAVEASISSANKMFGQQKFQTILEVATGLREDNGHRHDRGDYRGPIGPMDKLMNAGMLTPESFFHRLGKTGESLFRMLRNAQDKHIGIMQEAQKYTQDLIGKANVRKWEDDVRRFDFDGKSIDMTTAQIMSLYELMKRQQAVDHVVTGGIRIEGIKKGIKRKSMSDAVQVTPEEVSEILSVLTEDQIAIADGLQNFMGHRLSELGNEASMEVYGYEKFKEQNYFPIKVDSNQTITDQSKDAAAATIAGRGFTKSIKPKANNALLIRNIFDVYADHVTDMATYSSWLAPMENLQRVFNFKFRNEEGDVTGTVKGLLHRIFGKNGEAYWKKLTEDLNNGVKGVNDNPFQALIGNYKASAIGANIRVFIQQPTSILRALDTISLADFSAGLVKANPNTWKKVKKYAPIAVWKDWGYFDADTGRQMKSILFGDDSKVAKLNNALMAPAGAMDSLAWSHIWNALEAETARKHKSLQKGSDEFYAQVAKRFNEVVDHTQVVDGILQRSQLMRSPDGVTKMATSFMAEPTKIYNMFTTAAYDLRHSQDKTFRKNARKTMARTSAALLMSFVANAAAQSLVDAFRDDDKDEEYWEKFFQAFVGLEGDEETKMDRFKSIAGGNMGSALNPFGYLPFVKDVVSLVEGYDVARMDMESISNVVNAIGYCFKSINGDGKMTPANAIINLVAELSRFLGVPVSNIKRDVLSGINTWLNITDNYAGQYAVAKMLYDVNYSGNKGMFLDLAYIAWREGDKETFIRISQDLMDAFPDDVNGQTIESAMKSRTEKQMEKDPEFDPSQTLEDLIGLLPEYAEEEEKEDEFSAKNLNAEEYNRFMEMRADSYRKYEDAVTSSSVWADMEDKAKNKVISQLWKYAAQTALETVSGGKFVMDESAMVKAKNLETNYEIDPGTFFTLYGMTSVLKSDETADGETISDSLSYKKLMSVRESGLLEGYTDDQQDAVMGALDISGKVQALSESALTKLAAEIEEKKNAPSFFADFPEEKKDDVKGLLETLGTFSSDRDGNGKEIKGRKKQDKIKAEIYEHYNAGEYTAHQCYLIFHEFYENDKNNPWKYAKYG